MELTDRDYASLLEFRDGLRTFLHWSETQAARSGLTPAQHQLLLAVRGHRVGDVASAPSIGEIADHLMLRHHSAVELVDRAVKAGLVRRVVDEVDHRVVRITLTKAGERNLRELSLAHVEELSRIGRRFESLWTQLPG